MKTGSSTTFGVVPREDARHVVLLVVYSSYITTRSDDMSSTVTQHTAI